MSIVYGRPRSQAEPDDEWVDESSPDGGEWVDESSPDGGEWVDESSPGVLPGTFMGDLLRGVGSDIKASFSPKKNPLLEKAIGLGEAGLNTASSLGAGMLSLPFGLSAAAPHLLAGDKMGGQIAEETMGKIAEPLAYQPKTQSGQDFSMVTNAPFNAVSVIVSEAAKKASKDPETQAKIRVGGALALNILLGKLGAKIVGGQNVFGRDIKRALRDVKDLPKEIWNEIEGVPDDVRYNQVLEDMVKTSARKPDELPGARVEQPALRGAAGKAGQPPVTVPTPARPNPMADVVAKIREKIAEQREATTATRAGEDGAGAEPGGQMMGAGPAPFLLKRAIDFLKRRDSSGNRASLSPEQRAVDGIDHTQITALKEFMGRVKSGEAGGNLLSGAMTALVDDKYPLKRLVDYLKKSGKDVAISDDPYVSTRLHAGNEGVVRASMLKLNDIFNKYRVDKGDFTRFVKTLRLIDRAKKGLTNPGDIGLGEAKKALLDTLRSVGPKKARAMGRAANEFYGWANEEILGRYVKSGMLSPKDARFIREKNPHWLPFDIMRDFGGPQETFDVGKLKVGDSFVRSAPEIFLAKEDFLPSQRGAKKGDAIRNVWDSVVGRLEQAVALSQKNEAMNNLAKLGEENPELGIRKLGKNEKVPGDMGEFVRIRSGKAEKYVAPRDYVAALKTLDRKQMGLLREVVGNANAIYRAGTTVYYTPFMAANLVRDAGRLVTMARGETGPLTILNGIVQSFASAFGYPTKEYRAFLENRAAFSGILQRKAGRLSGKSLFDRKDIQIVKSLNPITFLRNIGEAIELSPRMSTWLASKKMGLSPIEAALQARDTTIDFGRGGYLLRAASQVVPYLNAKAQAMETTVEAAFSNKGASRGGKFTLLGVPMSGRTAFAARAITTHILPILGVYLYSKLSNPELMGEIDGDTKDKYVVIPLHKVKDKKTGEEKTKIITIPKGDLEQLFWNPIERLLDDLFEKHPTNAIKFAAEYLSDNSPVEFMRNGKFAPDRLASGAIPPLARGVVELMGKGGTNLYFGGPIVPQRLQGLAPEMQKKENTPGVYSKIAGVFNASPLKVQNIVRSAFGPLPGTASVPETIAQTGRRFVREVPLKSRGEVFETAGQVEVGYATTRAKMIGAVKNKDVREFNRLWQEWNANMGQTTLALAKKTNQPEREIFNSPFYRKYTFQRDDLNAIIRAALEEKSRATAADVLNMKPRKKK